MAALTILYPSNPPEWPIPIDSWLTSEPQGADDKQLRENAQMAVAHWKSRAEYLLAAQVADASYVSVPFKPVKKVRVIYRQVGTLKPAPYPLDE
jgi:hypothetical protein